VCECDHVRDPAVGAGLSPADPDRADPPDDDMVQAVVEFVDDLVDGPDSRCCH
jgi:hypothetical protein